MLLTMSCYDWLSTTAHKNWHNQNFKASSSRLEKNNGRRLNTNTKMNIIHWNCNLAVIRKRNFIKDVKFQGREAKGKEFEALLPGFMYSSARST